SPMLHDDPQLKAARRTEALDRPIESDPYGNAIVGAVVGGVIAGVGAAAAEALASSAGTTPVMEHIATQVGVGIAKGVAKEAVASTMNAPPEEATNPSGAARPRASSSPAPRSATPGPA